MTVMAAAWSFKLVVGEQDGNIRRVHEYDTPDAGWRERCAGSGAYGRA